MEELYINQNDQKETLFNQKTYFMWLFGTLAFSIGLQLILPSPYGLIVALGFYIALPFVYRKILIRKNGAGRFGGTEGKFAMVCSICGAKSRDRTCKRCGSNQFRMQ